MLEEKVETDANASIGASIVNMTNNVLGSGLVALAYSVSRVTSILDRSGIVYLDSWNSDFDDNRRDRLLFPDRYHSKLSPHLIPGILILMTIGAIACFSQIVITRSCRLTDKYTYKEMGQVPNSLFL